MNNNGKQTRAIHKGFLLNMKDIELNQIESQYRSFDAKAVMVFADFAIQIGIDFVNQLLARYPIQDQVFCLLSLYG